MGVKLLGSSRHYGKTYFAEMLEEKALDEGRTVLSITPKGIFKKKRLKHLTLIEKRKLKNSTLIETRCL